MRPRTFPQLEAQNNILFNCDPTTSIPQLASWPSFYFQAFLHKVYISIRKP
jgi:hypothetical protein